MATIEKFENIGLSGQSVGTLTFTGKGLEWRGPSNAKTVQAKDILRASWSVFGKWGHLRLFLKNGKALRCDGFLRTEEERVREVFQSNYSLSLEREVLNSGGANYGDLIFEDNTLVMSLEDKPVLELPLGAVSQCVLPGTGNIKNEVELQFVETDAADRDEDTLVEVRFYIPPGEEEDDGAEAFQKNVLARTTVQASTGDALVTFAEDEGFFLYPRGRYVINLYTNSFRLHGAKYDHKMAYDDIIHFFLLERPDHRWAFVIGLKKPIRQGQQRYNYLVLQTHDGASEVTVNMTEEELREKYEDRLEQTMAGPMHHLVAKTFKILSGKKVYHSQRFQSARNVRWVKCSLKASEGLLYPLDKAFMFIYKPTLYIPFKDIESVSFDRVGGAVGVTRTFDLRVLLRPLDGDVRREYIFAQIEKEEHANLSQYLRDKQTIKVIDDKPVSQAKIDRMLEEEEEGGEEEDEEDEEDESYKGEESGSEGSGSEGSEEGGSDDSSSGAEMVEESDLEEMTGIKKEKSSKGGKKKKEKGSGEEGSEEEEEEESDAGTGGKKRKGKKEKAGPGKKKKRAKKDPNAPKQALSAYMLFTQASREAVKAEQPGLKVTEISKVMGERWRALSAEEKKVFEDQAASAKVRYGEELRAYKAKKKEEAAESGGRAVREWG
ncbi:fact complex subunit ssrp1 [Nannochloropsis gaditana]|uniref:FACT complex subunit SSRP1 n=1 Tax=Nannochloropsis gaditana TaxID=72520 RepID=W7TS58_9STRA|nr:fact complex subunit ssrp1 [Nannochloropsis gaditana]